MSRWDNLLALPIQSPMKLEFSSADLEWSKVDGWSDSIEKVAFIPFDRVDHFLEGEGKNKEYPTRFFVEARRKGYSSKEKIDGVLEFTMYRCAFGPDDRREGGTIRPSRNTYIPKKKPSGRPSIKRGCQCYFFVKRLIAKPSAALIIYKQDKHIDQKGEPCHGPQHKDVVGMRATFAPCISDDLRLLLSSLLHVGVSVETIMHIYNESVEKEGGPSKHDGFLTHRYVRRLERSIRRSKYKLDEDDAVSIEIWADRHESDVFFREDYSDSNSFVLGIQTKWQLQQMIRYGNRSLLASDSRFGTNKLKYPVHSLLVFDSERKAIPVAWIITPQFGNGDIYRWMRALHSRVHSKDPTWKLAGFIVDDPSADVLIIREVFQCPVLICFWRVRHAWFKNLVEKCSDIEMRSELSSRLGRAIYSICKGDGNVDLFEDFMEDFLDYSSFMDYFRAVWYPRIGIWSTALKTLPLASQETSAAMEYYHHQLKLRLINEKDSDVYQRMDWLVDKLWTKVLSSVWLDEYPRKDDFTRYRKDKWVTGPTPWRQALKIPDSDVVLEGKRTKVVSQEDGEKAHVIWNPGSEFSLCDCSWAEMGNLCKHVIKVSQLSRNKGLAGSSISLFQYKQALINILHCPTHDSLTRDHAVSLALYVRAQLNSLIDPDSLCCLVNPRYATENVSSTVHNGPQSGCESRGDFDGEDETAGQKNVCTQMDIEPPDVITSTDDELRNEERDLFSTETDTDGNVSSQNGAIRIGNSIQDGISDKSCSCEITCKGLCGNNGGLNPQSVQSPSPFMNMDIQETSLFCSGLAEQQVSNGFVATKISAHENASQYKDHSEFFDNVEENMANGSHLLMKNPYSNSNSCIVGCMAPDHSVDEELCDAATTNQVTSENVVPNIFQENGFRLTSSPRLDFVQQVHDNLVKSDNGACGDVVEVTVTMDVDL
ncbi:hypothetical protein GIB67_003033 [Kingdonia uniflora]|uniref:SWIM-type domain-containing protein n=1 Tax=Kingdonia uniflora TaxID=39325 RepID=A0A7J7LYP1_9MAGN|nr:hypothetical protein GIB67_003033 [Kingdonia uniflora]